MGQSKPFRATALVVEDDPMQREMISLLLEESDFDVIECETAEAAELVLHRNAGRIALVMTDVSLAGTMDGVALAHVARRYNPTLEVIVTSGSPLPSPLPEGVESGSSLGRRWMSFASQSARRWRCRRSGRQAASRREIAPARLCRRFAAWYWPRMTCHSADLADRGRLARHRRALRARGGARPGLARERRGSPGLTLGILPHMAAAMLGLAAILHTSQLFLRR